ncbi:MAG: dihydroorotate dehydrogenase electron transfer subunit [Candidatus Omnitrophica bacterium]|nr:dihydroorotate dehydrogenase electron transfer subunit [Candidatus Omnitrophota bacterium]
MPIIQTKTRIISHIRIKDKYFRLTLKAAKIAKVAKPGQFLNIKITDNYAPLLRRPFSIHGIENRNIEILYEVVGQGTQILSQRKPGEYLDIIGPLGNGFSYHSFLGDYRLPILVAGGIGVAPLLFLAKRIISDYPKIYPLVLIGGQTEKEVLCSKDFRRFGCKVNIATDDGSCGFRGKVTDLLRHLLLTIDYRLSTIYACGPQLMLKEISYLSKEYNIPAEISLDEHMACGVGACLGCVVKTKEGYKQVCKDGPVFAAKEVLW